MNILAIDIGGTNVKLLATGQETRRRFPSGPSLTPTSMVEQVQQTVSDWPYDVVSIGYPGPILHGKIICEPHNLAQGWIGFDFEKAFGKPVKLVNDAAMQALGSYEGQRMLFLGLGTGLGSAMIINGSLEPMELAHLEFKKGTFEDYVGQRGLERVGKKRWRKYVFEVVDRLSGALHPDYVVLGGGNVSKLKELPPNCRLGDNANAFKGGFRLWDSPHE